MYSKNVSSNSICYLLSSMMDLKVDPCQFSDDIAVVIEPMIVSVSLDL